MKVLSYTMYNDGVTAILNNGQAITIYFNQDSGKIYYRYKTNTISNIKHAGVYIGNDIFGNGYFIHNHYQLGSPHLVTAPDFTLDKPLYLYHERCINAWDVIISNAFNHVIRQEPFKLLSYNCQTLVNSACNNQRKSEDAQKWLGGIAATALVGLFLGALLNKTK